MTIEFYTNISESHAVNKTIMLRATLSGTLKNPVNISNPVILIEAQSPVENPINYNYVRISGFNRYYFITGISIIRTNLWEISLHVDVLMSFKDDFLKLGAIIARQENEYNLFLKDNLMQVKVPRVITVKNFPNKPKTAKEGKGFVLTLAGGPIRGSEPESSG